MNPMHHRRLFGVLFFLSLLAEGLGCARSYVPDSRPLDVDRLPAPNISTRVPHLTSCTDSIDPTLHLDSNSPVTVLVHGCKGSTGRFRSLAQLFAFHGQQAVCFEYDDRKSLLLGAKELNAAIDDLAAQLRDHDVTVIGHSMGGLLVRKAMERDLRAQSGESTANIKLVTVSAPVSGIQRAHHCGERLLHWLTLGIIPAVCWFVTGDNWTEVNPSSNFIRHPGPLAPLVHQYLKVVTNEREACSRRRGDGTCKESDYVFSLAEQYESEIDRDPRLVNVEVAAGHAEIVGEKRVVPRKLLEVLQKQGILAPTPPERHAALERLLAVLYSR